MNKDTISDFQHVFVPGRSTRTLVLLHGTGGNENSLIPLGRELDPEAALLSPRGKVLENGMPRFFRRLAEGVFDEEDLIRRTHELAGFIEQASVEYGFDRRDLIAVGYSNGANIAGSLLLLRPGTLGGAVLLRPMVPLVPETMPDLKGVPVLVAGGDRDPIASNEEVRQLVSLLRATWADVAVSLENAGHELTESTVENAKRWLRAFRAHDK
jgi:predicted esterase